MSKAVYIVVAVAVAFQVALQVCLAEAKGRGRRRRCPNACVRKFDDYKKGSVGPPGPPGPPGLQGISVALPACKPGEYLTSDGQNLICKKLDLAGACAKLQEKCFLNGDKPPLKQTTDGKMIKFMKKNMIQSFQMDAWDAEAFYIGKLLFVGLSQLGRNSFILYQWVNNGTYTGLIQFQEFNVDQARNWEPFKINGEQYFVIASSQVNEPCPIYKWNNREFVKFEPGLPCAGAFDVEPFEVDNVLHIAVANYRDRQPAVIFKWDGTRFNKLQTIDVTAQYVAVFKVNRETYLGISGISRKGPYVEMYKWIGGKFALYQTLYTTQHPYELTELSVGHHQFIAVATYGSKGNTKTLLFRWNKEKFEPYQNISSNEARRVVAISSPMMGKKNGYLAVVNYSGNPAIYVWKRDRKFQLLQEIEAKGSRDISFFEMGDNVYLILSSHRRMEVFKGAAV